MLCNQAIKLYVVNPGAPEGHIDTLYEANKKNLLCNMDMRNKCYFMKFLNLLAKKMTLFSKLQIG